MRPSKLVDLSWPLRPGREARPLEIARIDATAVTHSEKRGEGWYIMHNVSLVSHIGTHVEVPYHALPQGEDLARVALRRWVGMAAILDLRDTPAKSGISLERLKRAAEEAGGIERGDFAFCCTGWDRYYGTERYGEAPFVSREGLRWLVEQGLALFGMDWAGGGDPAFPDRDNHLIMFEAGIPYIENMHNLSEVAGQKVLVAALPLAIEGLESFPLRVVAILE